MDVLPLKRPWNYASLRRGRLIWMTIPTIANKVFDLLPEILIGATDVIARFDDSSTATR